jgi:hypothetical protein
MNPPALFVDAHPCFILMDHLCFHQRCLELRFYFSQLLMTGSDKGGGAASRELNAEQFLQELAGPSVGHCLAFHKIGCQRADANSILRWSRNGHWERRLRKMKTPRAGFSSTRCSVTHSRLVGKSITWHQSGIQAC